MAKRSSGPTLSEDKHKRFVRQKVEPVDLRPGQTFIPHVSPIQEKLIGRTLVEFSRLDHLLSEMIWIILKLQMKDGRLITTRMEAEAKIALLRTLVPRYYDKAQRHAILSILDIADFLREDRNFVVHGLWGTLMPDNIPMVASIRPKSDPGTIISEAFPQSRLRNNIQATIRTISLLRSLTGARDTSPGK